jgi:transposase
LTSEAEDGILYFTMERCSKPSDPKVESLKKQGMLNPRPEKVSDEVFQGSEFFDARDLLQVKYEMLRRVEKDQKSVAQAAAAFGFSRPSFYKAKLDFAREGLLGLVPKRKGRKRAHKLTETVMNLIDGIQAEEGTLSGLVLAKRIEEKMGLRLHPRSIERALQRREKKRR